VVELLAVMFYLAIAVVAIGVPLCLLGMVSAVSHSTSGGLPRLVSYPPPGVGARSNATMARIRAHFHGQTAPPAMLVPRTPELAPPPQLLPRRPRERADGAWREAA
jgi:hypothetical protein